MGSSPIGSSQLKATKLIFIDSPLNRQH